MDKPVISERRSPLESLLRGRIINFAHPALCDKLGLPMSVVPLPTVYNSRNLGGNIVRCSFEFNGKSCFFTWTENGSENTVECAMDGAYAYSRAHLCSIDFTFASYAYWEDVYTLYIHLRPLESTGKRILKFDFSCKDRVILTPSAEAPISDMIHSVAWLLEEFSSDKHYRAVLNKALKRLERVAEPVHTGYFA